MADGPIRIVIVDDHQLVREGLAALIGSMKDLRVVGLSGDGAGGAAMILREAPDVALLDLSMPGTDGLGVLLRLRDGGSRTRVIILTTFDDDMAMLKASTLGAFGFLLKDLPREELESAIRAVHIGERVFRPTVTSTIREVLKPRRPDADRGQAIAPLTGREQEVLRLMAGGLGNKEIAFALGLSEGTVKNHVSVILDKFCAPDRTRAVLKAIERGLA
ncbi:MAG: response regulator transcription factor [Phycisphaerae bacterium]|jgi:DNA-binding NarL/FixJ family response regulator|nr:response regulator transcription factor [Phycisphaerae bacterium]